MVRPADAAMRSPALGQGVLLKVVEYDVQDVQGEVIDGEGPHSASREMQCSRPEKLSARVKGARDLVPRRIPQHQRCRLGIKEGHPLAGLWAIFGEQQLLLGIEMAELVIGRRDAEGRGIWSRAAPGLDFLSQLLEDPVQTRDLL
jgi:hypothetical protein